MTTTDSAESDTDLRYWLANEDWYMSRYTREWLERTPRDEVIETLTRIAADAVSEPRAPWAVAVSILAGAGLATSDGIGGKGPHARKAGTRAALMLADQDDLRAIPPLVRVYSTGGHFQSKYQSQIEAALTRLLTNRVETETHEYATAVRTLVERIWHGAGERSELSDVRAQLVGRALETLAAERSVDNIGLLRTIADSPVSNPTRQPNRVTVKKVAEALLSQAAGAAS